MRTVADRYVKRVAAVLIALASTVGMLLLQGCSSGPVHTPAPARHAPSRPRILAPRPSPAVSRPVLAVKIDNVDAARPQTGIGGAELVYVEPVEGGLTRLVAVYGSRRPAVVGPVRSARPTDLELLAQYGRPTLAYSGAAPPLLPQLRSAPIVNASPKQVPGAYYRDPSRQAPHNLYLHPAALPTGSPGTATAPRTGPAPHGGAPTVHQLVHYRAATYDFRWSPSTRLWLVWLNGTPFTDTESGQVGVPTVVVQKVAVGAEPFPEDRTGATAPPAHTVGHGNATVLRNGKSYQVTWARSSPRSPTRYRSPDGRPLLLHPGPAWILLVPA